MDWATHAAAKYAVERWHYSRTMPVGKSVKIGAWEDGKFIGVLIFSCGASPMLAHSIDVGQQECAELTRVAMTEHATPVTRMISIAVKILKRHSPGLRVLVSFADTTQGHHGGIYQGGGWTYIGLSEPKKVLMHRGRQIHNRAYQGRNKKAVPKGAFWKQTPGKHKYAMGLGTDDQGRLMMLAKPYPKRAS